MSDIDINKKLWMQLISCAGDEKRWKLGSHRVGVMAGNGLPV
jgi:hypothetical protein